MDGAFPKVVTRRDRWELDVAEAPPRPGETRVLMADPEHYAVEYVINPHMAGHVGSVDRRRAREQWEAVRAAYAGLGYRVEVLPGAPGLPDLVFTANQSFPFLRPDGRRAVVLSRMASEQRRPEVEILRAWHEADGAEIVELEGVEGPFEAMGDALWVPGRRVVCGGYGFRTDLAVYERLSEIVAAPIAAFELVDPRFYHLDTCLSLLDERTALWVPEAFTDEGAELLAALFPRLVEVPAREAEELFAANGHSPDGKHFLVQAGCTETVAAVRALGLEPIELDTSEFRKSGGSVFCMKLMLP